MLQAGFADVIVASFGAVANQNAYAKALKSYLG